MNDVVMNEFPEKMVKMMGFRNVLVHEYQQLDLSLMEDVIENHLDDLLQFTSHALKASCAAAHH